MTLEGYRRIEFWRAYCKFFFAPSEGNFGLLQLTDSLVKELPHGRPIKVLCLGIGVGGFEYPMLSALHSRLGYPLEVFGVDSAPETLPVADAVFRDLDPHRFPSSGAFADFIASSWTNNCIPSQRMRCLDLDGRWPTGGECQDLEESRQPWKKDFPSRWHDKIQDIIPQNGFDVITAAFCFHHMQWWRPALCNALRMLREGGLLMLSRVDGDVNYLDWNQPEPWLTKEREVTESGTLVRDMMQRFYAIDRLRVEWLVRAQAGAIKPWEQIDLIEKMPLEDLGLHRHERFEYHTRNIMAPRDVLDIIDTCGLSSFRWAKAILGESQYKGELNKLSVAFESREPDVTRNRIRWHCYRVPSEDVLKTSGLFRRFATSLPSTSTETTSKDEYSVLYYEFVEASVVAHNSFKTTLSRANVKTEDFASFLRDLSLSGTLCHTTPFGVMGQRLVRQEAFKTALCFLNPLGPSSSLTELMAYLCLRQTHLSNFSNSNVLLKQVLPEFRVPVVFSYIRGKSTELGQSSVALQFQRYRSFLEICFVIKLPEDFLEKIINTKEFGSLKKIIDTAVVASCLNQINKEVYPDPGAPRRASFVLNVPDIPNDELPEFSKATISISERFSCDFGLNLAMDSLSRSWRQSGYFDEKSKKDWSTVFSREMVETFFWLCLIPNWQKTVIYPATYSDPRGNAVQADDSLILFYDKPLSEDDLRHEYRKVTLMFDELNMRRLATLGEASGTDDMLNSLSHELSKQTTVLFSNRLRKMSDIFEVNDIPRTNDTRDSNDWPAPAGKVAVAPANGAKIGEWLVCPSPTLFESLRNYLVLWAGSPGALNKQICNVKTLEDFIKAAVAVAKWGCVAVKAKDISPKDMEKVRAAEEQAKKDFESLPEIKITMNEEGNPLLHLSGVTEPSKRELVLNLIFRAIASAVANALQHTKPGDGDVEIDVQPEFNGMWFVVRNPAHPSQDEGHNLDGTAGVIRSCLRRIDKDGADPDFGMDPARPGVWRTRFFCPSKAKYRNDTVEWLNNE